MRLTRRATPYLLLAPGLAWLAVFFLVPMYYLLNTSLQTGSLDVGYTFTWAWSNYKDALTQYQTQFIRSVEYAGLATIFSLLISYPLAYWIAFRAGRWRNLFLLLVIAPFFVTYLIRTLAWETILSDSGFIVSTLHSLGVLPGGRLLATPATCRWSRWTRG
jgi:spermidine/putrescine transport system permease protein